MRSAKAQTDASGDCGDRLRDQFGGVGIGEDLDLVAVDRAAGFHRVRQRQHPVQRVDDPARRTVVDLRAQAGPAGQRHFRPAVQVLHRILEPPGAAPGTQQPQQVRRPAGLEILAFVDDQHVDAGRLVRLPRIQCLFQPGEGARLAEVGALAERAGDAVAELVVGDDVAALRRDARDMVGQRPVVADEQRLQPGGHRIAEHRERKLGLARAGSADDAQPERIAVDAARPVRKAAGESGIERLGLAHEGIHFRHQLQDVAEEPMHLVARGQYLVAGAGGRQQFELIGG